MDRNGSIHHYIIKSSEKIPVIKPALVVLNWSGKSTGKPHPVDTGLFLDRFQAL